MEPARGIEPLPLPYEGSVLPLSLSWHGAPGGSRTLTRFRAPVSETGMSTRFHHLGMERLTGFEPVPTAWKAVVLGR